MNSCKQIDSTGFYLNEEASVNGTSYHGIDVILDPKKIIEGLLDGGPFDDYKSSKEWTFTNEDGHVFTLYDWKCTSNYDSELPPPAVYWSQPQVRLHMGHFAKHTEEAKALKVILEALYK